MNSERKFVYIGFGANLGDPLDTYAKAKILLEAQLGPIVKESSMYESGALTLEGTASQTNYFNAVLAFVTEMPAQRILPLLLETETHFKRTRNEAARWAPRPIDLDILFIESDIVNEEQLTIPHPELHKRDFVLCPLLDIAPDLVHPILGETVAALESSLEARGCERLIIRRCPIRDPQQPPAAALRCEREDTGSIQGEPSATAERLSPR